MLLSTSLTLQNRQSHASGINETIPRNIKKRGFFIFWVLYRRRACPNWRMPRFIIF